MFKKTSDPQLNMFSSPSSLLSGKSHKIYEDPKEWHNQFRKHVACQIDENCFKPLYCSNNGTPNASIRVLISMMILKEAEGMSDQKLFENCRFNMLTRSALGLLNADDPVPTESTYYLLRKRIVDYEKENKENLFDIVFSQLTKKQCLDFDVSGKRIRMDSKLMGSNIAWFSRYELIHQTFRLFYHEVKQMGMIDHSILAQLDDLLKLEGNKIVYTCSIEEVKSRLQQLGVLINSVLPLFSSIGTFHYQTLKRVFEEQYKVDEGKIVTARPKEEIAAQSLQSPHDTDCTYRNKDGNQVKGFSINITESCDDGEVLNLIGHVDVRNASTSDLDFLQDGIKKAQEVFVSKIENAHADGAFNSAYNQSFCKDPDNNIQLHLHAIQGAKGRYTLDLNGNELTILDTDTDEIIDNEQVKSKLGIEKWRIKTEKGYRYFTQKDIDTCLIRKKIEETPKATLQKRNNVEATIFQLGYHYPNAKSRYRSLVKHQLWAVARCLWLNFVRICNFPGTSCPNPSFFVNNSGIEEAKYCFYVFLSILAGTYPNKNPKTLKFQFLGIFEN